MARNLGSQCKLCRREQEKLFLKGSRCYSTKCPMIKRNYPPGIHGQKGYLRQTEYALQLREKQKAKRTYGVSEKQFINYYKKAKKEKKNTGDVFLQLLEMRLDNVIYRLNLASSRVQARQLVTHRHFLVNGRIVNIPSFEVKLNDVIKIKEKSFNISHFKDVLKTIKKAKAPAWLNLDSKTLEGKVLSRPQVEDLKQNFDIQQIIEYYSR